MTSIDRYTEMLELICDDSRSKRSLEIFFGRDSIERSFVEGLSNGAFNSDVEASSAIYGAPPSDNRYRFLKSKLFNSLCTVLLVYNVDQADHPAIRKHRFTSYKLLACAVLLISLRLQKLATIVLEKLVKKSKRYGLTEIVIFCLEKLEYYAIMRSDEREFNRLRAELKKFITLQNAEFDLWDFYVQVAMLFGSRSALNAPEIEFCKKMERKARNLKLQFPSPKIMEYYFNLASAVAIETRDFRKLQTISDEFLEWYKLNPSFSSKSRRAHLYFYQLLAAY